MRVSKSTLVLKHYKSVNRGMIEDAVYMRLIFATSSFPEVNSAKLDTLQLSSPIVYISFSQARTHTSFVVDTDA